MGGYFFYGDEGGVWGRWGRKIHSGLRWVFMIFGCLCGILGFVKLMVCGFFFYERECYVIQEGKCHVYVMGLGRCELE